MHKEILVFVWLNSEVRFVSCSHGKVVSSWTCADAIDLHSSEIGAVIQQGVKETRFKGKNLAVVLANRELSQQLVETPPTRGKELDRFLERQINQFKVCEGDAAWGYDLTHEIKDSNGVVLYLLPDSVRAHLTAAAKISGLHLLSIVPPSGLMLPMIEKLSLEGNALLAIDTNGSTSFIVANREGLYLARSMACRWQDDPARASEQIKRSEVFLRQQFGKFIDQVCLIGENGEEASRVIQADCGKPTLLQSQNITAEEWACSLASQPPGISSNLVSTDQQRAPQRRKMIALTVSVMSVIALSSIAISGWIELSIRAKDRKLAMLQTRVESLDSRKAEIDANFEDLYADERLAEFVENRQLPPAPGMFLRYLSEVLPRELVLTKLQINRVDRFSGDRQAEIEGRWTVRIEGGVSWEVVGENETGSVRTAYLTFANELAEGPFHLEIAAKTRQFAPRRNSPDWSVSSRSRADQFFVEGVMYGGVDQISK